MDKQLTFPIVGTEATESESEISAKKTVKNWPKQVHLNPAELIKWSPLKINFEIHSDPETNDKMIRTVQILEQKAKRFKISLFHVLRFAN